jgi:hypothetical protein
MTKLLCFLTVLLRHILTSNVMAGYHGANGNEKMLEQ